MLLTRLYNGSWRVVNAMKNEPVSISGDICVFTQPKYGSVNYHKVTYL